MLWCQDETCSLSFSGKQIPTISVLSLWQIFTVTFCHLCEVIGALRTQSFHLSPLLSFTDSVIQKNFWKKVDANKYEYFLTNITYEIWHEGLKKKKSVINIICSYILSGVDIISYGFKKEMTEIFRWVLTWAIHSNYYFLSNYKITQVLLISTKTNFYNISYFLSTVKSSMK